MPVTKDMLVSELQSLLRMTAFEQSIATIRRTQAGSSDIAEELKANAAKSGERLALLAGAVKQVGGFPDVVGPWLGKAGAFVQSQLNQVQTLQGALLGDLTLEHQLRERTRYARTLADSLGYSQVLPVLDRLEVAHSATIEWLETRLAEVGRTGSSALKATPVQAAVAAARHLAGAPLGFATQGVNRLSGLVQRVGSKAAEEVTAQVQGSVEQVQDAAHRVAADVYPVAAKVVAPSAPSAVPAVPSAPSAPSEPSEPSEPSAPSAPSAVPAVDEFGAVGSFTDNTGVAPDGVHPPFAGYDKLSGDSVMRHVGESSDVPDLQVLQAYEEAHRNRKGVIQAVEARLTELGTSAR